MDRLKGRGYDVLLFTDSVDEFIPEMLHSYKEKEFRNISAEDLGLESEEEKKAMEEKTEQDKELLDFLKEALGDQVKTVALSGALGSHAVSLKPEGGVSFEMEKYFNRVNPGMGVRAERILELNPEHPVFAALKKAKEEDPEKARNYAALLYDQALLIADMPIENPTAFADRICELMV